MKLEHIAIWTNQLESLKNYYEKYFNGRSNQKYINPVTQFESYFITFDSGARLELMTIPGLSDDYSKHQRKGLIHIAFEVSSRAEVDVRAKEFMNAGLPILRGPRVTGDGYYEFETSDPDNNKIEVTTSRLK